jgi:peptidoglycan/LPS O-acetylase OafA/YrhL
MMGGPSHAGLRIPLIVQGHVGVQLFMVISGFILAVISHGKEIDPLRFYWNRALRIYPLLVFVAALGYFSTPDGRPASSVADFLIALSPISNLSRLNYGPFGGQLWTIAVELQFYLLFPLFHSMLARRGPRYHLSLIALLIVLRAAVFQINGTVADMSYYSIFGALDAFLAGQICGWLYREGRFHLKNPIWAVGTFAALNALLWLVFRGNFFIVAPPSGYTGPATSPSPLWIIWPDILAIIFAIMIPAYIQCTLKIPLSKLWSTCGRYSYSIYLWHILVITVIQSLHPATISPYVVGVIALLATIPLAAASYHLIERPFLERRVVYTALSVAATQKLSAAE